MCATTKETIHIGTVLYNEKNLIKYLVIGVNDTSYICLSGNCFEPVNIEKNNICHYINIDDDKDINMIITSLKEGSKSSEKHDGIISAEEARKISDDVNKNEDDNEIRLIAERIRQACAEGDYEITICHDDGQLSTFLRDNTERILTELGYKMHNEHGFTFGAEYDLIISWERNS